MPINAVSATIAACWIVAVIVGGVLLHVNTFVGWTAMALFAVLPPLVAAWRFKAPSQTMSESIRDALR